MNTIRDWVVIFIALLIFSGLLTANERDIKWMFQTRGKVSTPAVGDDGTIYIGSTEGALYAINYDGSEQWRYSFGADSRVGPPSVGKDGSVYFYTATHGLIALDSTGNKKWDYFWPGDALDNYPIIENYPRSAEMAPTIGPDGTIYAANSSRVIAFHSTFGYKIHEDIIGASLSASPLILGDGAVVFFTDYYYEKVSKGGIAATRETCTPGLAQCSQNTAVPGTEPPPGEANFYGVVFASSDPAVDVISNTLLWPGSSYPQQQGGLFFIENRGSATRKASGDWPVLSSNKVIYTSSSSGLRSFDRDTGNQLHSTGNVSGIQGALVIGSDGTVYISATDRVHALNANLTERWRTNTMGTISMPTMGPDGTIYVGSNDGRLYAIESASSGPDHTQWPMWHRDARHSNCADPACDFYVPKKTLSVSKIGNGAGLISSSPNGITCGSQCSAGYDTGTVVTLMASANNGSSFAGWSGACSGTGGCTVTLDAAKTVSATFTLNPISNFSLTVINSGNGTVVSSSSGINCGSSCSGIYNSGTIVALSAFPGTGASFVGWGGACSGTGICTVALDAAKTVSATFNLNTIPTYTMSVINSGTGKGTIVSNPSGINCGTSCSGMYNSGTLITLSAVPDNGSSFAGWGGACSGTSGCIVTLDSAKTVSATFTSAVTVPTLTVIKTGSGSITSSPAGISCGAKCAKAYTSSKSVKLKAKPARNFLFAGWSGACTGTGICTITVDTGLTVYAHFVEIPKYTLSVTKAGSGSGAIMSIPTGIKCGSQCSKLFLSGKTVILKASPSRKSRFSGWSGDCGGVGKCRISISKNAIVTATFDAK